MPDFNSLPMSRRFTLPSLLATAVALPLLIGAEASGLSAPAGNGQASGKTTESTGESLVKTELLANVDRVQSGRPFRVAIVFTIEPKWHVYWKNPGESGSPIMLDLSVPAGFQVSAVEWPAPQVFENPADTTIGYAKSALLFATITPPADAAAIPITTEIKCSASWLVCKERCLFGKRDHSLGLPSAEVAKGAAPTVDPRIAQGEKRLPKRATEVGVKARLEGDFLVLEGPAEAQPIWFLPAPSPGVDFGSEQFFRPTIADGRFTFRVPFNVRPQDSLGQPLRAAGAILVGDPAEPRLYTEIDLAVTSPAPARPS